MGIIVRGPSQSEAGAYAALRDTFKGQPIDIPELARIIASYARNIASDIIVAAEAQRATIGTYDGKPGPRFKATNRYANGGQSGTMGAMEYFDRVRPCADVVDAVRRIVAHDQFQNNPVAYMRDTYTPAVKCSITKEPKYGVFEITGQLDLPGRFITQFLIGEGMMPASAIDDYEI